MTSLLPLRPALLLNLPVPNKPVQTFLSSGDAQSAFSNYRLEGRIARWSILPALIGQVSSNWAWEKVSKEHESDSSNLPIDEWKSQPRLETELGHFDPSHWTCRLAYYQALPLSLVTLFIPFKEIAQVRLWKSQSILNWKGKREHISSSSHNSAFCLVKKTIIGSFHYSPHGIPHVKQGGFHSWYYLLPT